ncbi:anion permease [Criblamydia sequanensis]|uniref:Na+-dependent transporter n=1 Tax=Candidatus Criblamydia sequanensis CRIB-18 TaxID=1437425 RepID=A0A090CYH1_9BACT|nr:anion permease [Criblamydia sequanensis]CDR33597.1 Na+-dependent transporter [Criblamydia sequanensis CRIB-18]
MVKKVMPFFLTFAVGFLIWLLPIPEGITEQSWHLFAIFVATIFGVVARPLPMGGVAFMALAALIWTKTLPFDVAFSGFSNESVWLIVFAYFVARAFIKTGLGTRLSFVFMQLMGKRTIGLGYGILTTDLVLAPAIPSNTARTGGLILPIVESLSEIFESKPKDPSSRKMGAYLSQVAIQASCVTSAMFLTAMSANPLIADIAGDMGIPITWGSWALAAIVPGAICLLAIPLLVYWLIPPEIKFSPGAPALAKARLKAIGPISTKEWILLFTFFLLLILWMSAAKIGVKPTTSALTGLVILLCTGVLSWDDVKKEHQAWETLIWFATLLTMATQLGKLGFTSWLSDSLVQRVVGYDWKYGFAFLSIAYFYAHYFFASNLAHVSAMYATFLSVSIILGTPPHFAAYTLGFFSSLFGALTQYTSGPSALLFGAGYVDTPAWWRAGLALSIFNIIVWLFIGGLWWKFLGLW